MFCGPQSAVFNWSNKKKKTFSNAYKGFLMKLKKNIIYSVQTILNLEKYIIGILYYVIIYYYNALH